MDLLQGLLVHLLFILVIWLLSNLVFVRKKNVLKVDYNLWETCFLSGCQILLCIIFSIPVGNGFYYDLRFIPFLIGSVYGGKKAAVILAIFIIILRYPLGGDGFWVQVAIYSAFGLIFLFVIDKIIQAKQSIRLAIMTLSAFFYAIPAYLIPSIINNFFDINVYLIYVCVLTLSTFFVAYLVEILKSYNAFQSEALKYEKLEVVSQLAASISHEVRNPLTAVKGFLQLINEQTSNDAVKKYSAIALEESDRASGIIEDYLTFAKPQPEKLATINVAESVEKVLEILKPLALTNGISFEMNIADTAFIKGDPNKFRQALINICKNGIESMNQNGVLSVEVKKVTKDTITINIKDTGIGMLPEQLARLGEPFYSLKEGKGTGLGMMVVFRIVKSMDGKMNISSMYNEGTTVSLTFPIIE